MKRFSFLLLILCGIITLSAAQAADPLRQEGMASWYGDEYAGKPTASGEIFNPAIFTAAHPSLPFGTDLLVTNMQNKRQVRVRVNDRGPFVASRIIDVSRAAAEALDMISAGVVPVIVERAGDTILDPVAAPAVPVSAASPQTFIPPAQVANIIGGIPPAGSAKTYRLQVGAYRVPRNAVDTFSRLKNAGLNPAYEQSGDFYRVVLAGLRANEIQSVAQILWSAGFREAIIREETGR
jgi:rare lipoprotein A